MTDGKSGRMPATGSTWLVSDRASVQFGITIIFRVIRVHDWTTYDGWCWLDGYELNREGVAVDRRSIFVRLSGLIPPVVGPSSKGPRRSSARSARRATAAPKPTAAAETTRGEGGADMTDPKDGDVVETTADDEQ